MKQWKHNKAFRQSKSLNESQQPTFIHTPFFLLAAVHVFTGQRTNQQLMRGTPSTVDGDHITPRRRRRGKSDAVAARDDFL